MVEARIQADQSFISLVKGSPDPTGYGVQVTVEANVEGFAGRNREVWFFRAEADRFMAELEQLDQLRRGSATIESMSPGEMRLTISIVDRTGHVNVTVELRRFTYVSGQSIELAMPRGFELDPTDLPGAVRDLKAVF
jgi:hypothetical protein